MTQLARSDGASGALFDLEGTWPINATVAEDIYFTEAGSPMSDGLSSPSTSSRR